MFTNPILILDAELVVVSNDPDIYNGLSCSRSRNLRHVC